MNAKAMPSLCRDCLLYGSWKGTRCQSCQGSRIVRHPDLELLSVAHIDCDAFYASVEKRDNPSLHDRPVIVGGGRRGVVTTCCYTARLYGVRSAMPMFKALKACPDAVVIRPDFPRYRQTASLIRQLMLELTPLVETVSIDEAYLDLSGTHRLHKAPPAVVLARLAQRIETEAGVTVSIGLSSNKFLAKTASELDKPRGFAVLSPGEAEQFLAPKPTSFLHGVGSKLAETLARDGFQTIADLQAASEQDLISQYGEAGLWLKMRAHGRDDREVQAEAPRKSISAETTFGEDISAPDDLEDHLWALCDKVTGRAKQLGHAGRVAILKLRAQDFTIITRRASIATPTQLAHILFRALRPLLAREIGNGKRFRLMGVALTNLSAPGAEADDLIDPRIAKRSAAERASDAARARFGPSAVRTGRAVRSVTPDEV